MRPFAVKLDESLAEGFSRQMMALASDAAAKPGSISLLGRAARAVSRATSQGHACLKLSDLLGSAEEGGLREARELLFASGLVAAEGTQPPLPLVLDTGDRLYLGRYFAYEKRLAAMLIARAGADSAITAWDEEDAARFGLVFQPKPTDPSSQIDWQRLAAALALCKRLTIITGGPGTGKTTTVVNLLACLLAKNPELRIALAAPTGKAAQRMQDAIRDRGRHLPAELRTLLPSESFTIHRLLGVIPDSHLFRHHAANQLGLDVLVIDEASMLDLALTAKLLAAVPEQARLILLGDKDQLAAVEAGAVFSEICTDPTISDPCRHLLAKITGISPEAIQSPAVAGRSPLQDAVIWLTENHRFGKESGIGGLAAAINTQQTAAVLACLREEKAQEVRWHEDGGAQLAPESLRQLVAGFDEYLSKVGDPGQTTAAIFEALDRFRILCAIRDSERGVDWLNRHISADFRQRLHHADDDGHSGWYPGRPLMILKNDYVLKLFNGDIGICLPTAEGRLLAHFPANDGSFRQLDPVRLPPHETAFAMTVHKAQGSEFAEVAVVLPAYASTVLTKELLYTAVTRCRTRLSLYGSASVLEEAIGKRCQRHSGLLARMASALPMATPS